MKKLTSLLLALILIVSLPLFVSCQKSTYQIFFDAYEKYNALDSLDATMNITMKMEMTGATVEIPMSYDILATGIKTENPTFSADLTMSMLGMDMSYDIYCDSEYFYVSMMGEKIKISVDEPEGAGEYDVLGDMDSLMVELPEEVFTDLKFTENSDGTKALEMTISEEVFGELFADLADDLANSATEGLGYGDLSFENIKIKLTVNKDGYLTGYDVGFVMNITMNIMDTEFSAKVTTDCAMVINNPGKAVTVTPPADLASYTESPDISLY